MDWNPKQKINGISIQVCLNGYSFKVEDDGAVTESGWRGADTVFTAPEFQRRYRHVEVSLFTPKVALVPRTFFDESTARQSLADTVVIGDGDEVSHASLPEYAAELVYSLSIGEMLSRTISQAVLDFDGRPAEILPEMYYIAAECRISGPDKDLGEARSLLQEVRKARAVYEELDADLDEAGLMAQLEKEYRKEFICEGVVFYFYKRLGYEKLPRQSDVMSGSKVIDDAVYMLPYPDFEIQSGRVQ